MKISVGEAKQKLSHLLDLVTVGGEVVITRAGKPIAKLIPVRTESSPARRFLIGSARGEFAIPDDFNDPLPKEIEDLFYE
jgi:prevent-host-death family protein